MKRKKLWVVAALIMLLSGSFLPMFNVGAQEVESPAVETTATSSSEQVLESEVQPPEQEMEPSQPSEEEVPAEQTEAQPQANAPPQVIEDSQPTEGQAAAEVEAETATETVAVQATEVTGRLVIKLFDEGNNQLQLGSGVFHLIEESGKYNGLAWTDLNKDTVYTDLPSGKYTLEQVGAPIGYLLSGFKTTFEMKEGATYFEYTVTNKRDTNPLPMGDIHVISVDKDDPSKRLAGATFTIVNRATGEVFLDESAPTDDNGELAIKNVPAGNYMIYQSDFPEGYTSPTIQISFSLTEKNIAEKDFPEFTYTNIKRTEVGFASIAFLPSDEVKLIAGGEFTLYDADGNVLERKITKNDEVLYFNDLQPGNRYRIKQTKAPEGYEESTEEKPLFDETFDITYQELAVRYTVYNNKLPGKADGKVTIKNFAEGDESATIGDAEFTLYDADGNVVATQITKGGQDLVFAELSKGTYRIKETKAPAGYHQSTFEEEFEITQANKAVEYKVFNKKIPAPAGKLCVQLYTEGDEKETIGGAEFTLYNGKGETVARKTTIAGEELIFENLDTGIYFLRETKMPEGYEEQFIQKNFDIKTSTSVKTIKITNKKLSTSKNVIITGKARDKSTGGNEGYAQKASTIIEEVSYQNLEVGKEYTIKTVLMDPATNQPVLVNGKEVRVEKTFAAKKPNGTIDVDISFDGSSLAGKSVVVVESLYQAGKEVADDSNIAAPVQTITYPVIATKAAGQLVGENVQIKDTITYNNLVVGQKYTVKGQLMDQVTGLPYQVNGKKVVGEASFTAEKMNGTVVVTFEFAKSALTKATTFVVFEQLFNGKGSLVGDHQEVTDANQMVKLDGTTPVDKPVSTPTDTPKETPAPAVPEPVKPSDSTVIGKVSWRYSWYRGTKKSVKPVKTATAKQVKTLPKTGSHQNTLWILGGFLLIACGVVIASRRIKLTK